MKCQSRFKTRKGEDASKGSAVRRRVRDPAQVRSVPAITSVLCCSAWTASPCNRESCLLHRGKRRRRQQRSRKRRVRSRRRGRGERPTSLAHTRCSQFCSCSRVRHTYTRTVEKSGLLPSNRATDTSCFGQPLLPLSPRRSPLLVLLILLIHSRTVPHVTDTLDQTDTRFHLNTRHLTQLYRIDLNDLQLHSLPKVCCSSCRRRGSGSGDDDDGLKKSGTTSCQQCLRVCALFGTVRAPVFVLVCCSSGRKSE